MAFIKATQHSVHPTGGSLRVFRRLAWLQADSGKVALPHPAHQRVTQTVGQPTVNNEIDLEIRSYAMNFFDKIFGTNKEPPSASEKKRFSSTGRESLEQLGYTIFTLHGEPLATLHARTGQPVLDDTQKGEFVYRKRYRDFWYEVSLATEVAINSDSPILPESSDISYRGHQRMVAEFSDVISKQVPGASAIIGTASYYVELALIYRRATRKLLFEDDVRLVTRSEYEGASCLVQVGQFKGALYCWDYYWPGTGGSVYVWLMPLVVPQGIR
jgi:hypothetical protein